MLAFVPSSLCPSHRSTTTPLLQECLAGLNSDPSSVLECAPLDLSRPLPLDPLDAVRGLDGGAAAAAAAEGGRASPASDGSGSSANLDDGGCWLLFGWVLLVWMAWGGWRLV